MAVHPLDPAQVLVLHDVAGLRIDHDGAAGAVVFPALEQVHGLVGIDLAVLGLDHVEDRGHAVVALDHLESRHLVLAELVLIGLDEGRIGRRLSDGGIVQHGDDVEGHIAHGVEPLVGGDVAGPDQLDPCLLQADIAERLHDSDRLGARRHEDEERRRLRVLDLLHVGREVRVLQR